MKNHFLKAIELLGQVPEIRWRDADKGQIDAYQQRPAVAFPCGLVKVDLPRCEDFGGRVQHCNAVITIRLGFDYTGETSAAAPEPVVQSSLSYYDTLEKVYKAFQGAGDINLGFFSRISAREETRRDGLKVMTMVFASEFNDETAEG